jgi:hypothetical protein
MPGRQAAQLFHGDDRPAARGDGLRGPAAAGGAGAGGFVDLSGEAADAGQVVGVGEPAEDDFGGGGVLYR